MPVRPYVLCHVRVLYPCLCFWHWTRVSEIATLRCLFLSTSLRSTFIPLFSLLTSSFSPVYQLNLTIIALGSSEFRGSRSCLEFKGKSIKSNTFINSKCKRKWILDDPWFNSIILKYACLKSQCSPLFWHHSRLNFFLVCFLIYSVSGDSFVFLNSWFSLFWYFSDLSYLVLVKCIIWALIICTNLCWTIEEEERHSRWTLEMGT